MVKSYLHIVQLMVTVFATLFLTIGCAQADEYKMRSEIEGLINNIKTESSPTRRFEIASELRLQVANASEIGQTDLISDASIDEIANLLADRATRLWAASTVKMFGIRACGKLPALQLALEDEEQMRSESLHFLGPQVDAIDVIRSAIQELESQHCK